MQRSSTEKIIRRRPKSDSRPRRDKDTRKKWNELRRLKQDGFESLTEPKVSRVRQKRK